MSSTRIDPSFVEFYLASFKVPSNNCQASARARHVIDLSFDTQLPE